MKYFPIVGLIPGVALTEQKHYRAKYSGECRPPKKGEFFLSGAIVEAHLAVTDMLDTQVYRIAKIVKVEINTITTIKEIE